MPPPNPPDLSAWLTAVETYCAKTEKPCEGHNFDRDRCLACEDTEAEFNRNARTDLPFAVHVIRGLMEALREVEWIRDRESDYEYCPACDNSRDIRGGGHAKDCTTKATLQEAHDART